MAEVSDEADPVAALMEMPAWFLLAPWTVAAGPLTLGPMAGVDYRLLSYDFNFDLYAMYPTTYPERDSVFSQSYGDFVGFTGGVWLRWSDLLGSATFTFSPLGPLMSNMETPTTITVIQGNISEHSQVQDGMPVSFRLNAAWDRFFFFNPGLSWEVGAWHVKVDDASGSEDWYNRHQALYLTLAVGFFPEA